MSKVCLYVDYCIANEEDAKDVFGIEADNTDINTGKLDRNGYISVAKKLTEKIRIQRRGDYFARKLFSKR